MALPPRSVPFQPYHTADAPEVAARRFYETMNQRRSVRFFSEAPVSEETIRWCIAAAGTAPSGANKQPWRFVAISDPALKREIRAAAEHEEREFYERRATPEWLADLAPLGTDPDKSFLETAPWLIVVLKLMKTDPDERGLQGKVYYVDESVGIACGLLIAAIHHAGLVTLTHTPSPMGFLAKVLNRPAHERPYLLLPVGHPAPGCVVPDIQRKALSEIMSLERGPAVPG
jgi:nitroreductase